MGRTDRLELAQPCVVFAFAARQSFCREAVCNTHKFVGVGALISAGANSRCHRPKGDGAIRVDSTGQVTAAVGGGIERRGIVRHAVGNADVEAVLEDIGTLPRAI